MRTISKLEEERKKRKRVGRWKWPCARSSPVQAYSVEPGAGHDQAGNQNWTGVQLATEGYVTYRAEWRSHYPFLYTHTCPNMHTNHFHKIYIYKTDWHLCTHTHKSQPIHLIQRTIWHKYTERGGLMGCVSVWDEGVYRDTHTPTAPPLAWILQIQLLGGSAADTARYHRARPCLFTQHAVLPFVDITQEQKAAKLLLVINNFRCANDYYPSAKFNIGYWSPPF